MSTSTLGYSQITILSFIYETISRSTHLPHTLLRHVCTIHPVPTELWEGCLKICCPLIGHVKYGSRYDAIQKCVQMCVSDRCHHFTWDVYTQKLSASECILLMRSFPVIGARSSLGHGQPLGGLCLGEFLSGKFLLLSTTYTDNSPLKGTTTRAHTHIYIYIYIYIYICVCVCVCVCVCIIMSYLDILCRGKY